MPKHNTQLVIRPRTSWMAIAAFTAAITPPVVSAQQPDYGGYARVALSSAEIYNGNLFSAPSNPTIGRVLPLAAGALPPSSAVRTPESDLFSRFGTALETGYVAVPLQVIGRYELDAERYLDHPELNRNVARQDGSLSLDYFPIP